MKSNPIPTQLIEQIAASINQHLQLAEQAFNCQFHPPQVSFNVRGKAAGKAYCHLWQIRLNPVLLLENQTAFLQQVVPHELAHLITYHQFGRVRPHGKEWQFVMQHVFNLAAHTRHQFDITSVSSPSFAYQCDCQQHQLSLRRHNKVIRGQTQYQCRHCKATLQPIG